MNRQRQRPGKTALVASLLCGLCGAAGLRAQNPRGYIQSDAWACLVPLDGADCTGGGEEALRESWVAPRSLADEDPVVGTVWDDVDFGGAARSRAWLGRGVPRFARVSRGRDADAVDFRAALDRQGLPTSFALGIAVTYVENASGAPLPVGVCTASDDSVQVWIGADLVLSKSVCRALDATCAEVSPAVLAPGTNRIAVAVWQGIGEFGFRLALARPDGSLYAEGDPEVIVLGASGPPRPSGPFPALTRSFAGDRFLCPDAHHDVVLEGDSAFGPLTVHEVREELRGPVSGDDISLVSDGGNVEPFVETPPRAGEFYHGVVGVPCGAGSHTRHDGELYTTVARTGGDIWVNGDTFSFAYRLIEGDFDAAIEIAETRLPAGRWSKFGIMARKSLEADARFCHIQDLGPDPGDSARYARRTRDGVAESCEEHPTAGVRDPNTGEPLAHPRYLRLTRKHAAILARVSATAGDGGRDPRDDRNWATVFSDAWAGAPERLYLGFALSVNESSGCAPGEVDWLPLFLDVDPPGGEVELPPAGVRIAWNVPGSIIDGRGLSYRVRADRGTDVSVVGWAAASGSGASSTRGPGWMGFQDARGGPEGPFEAWHDVGRRGPCTPGRLSRDDKGTPDPADDSFRIEASGRDIWQDGDQFTFAHRTLTGDFDVRARFRLARQPPEGRWGKFGVMARWDCRPDAAYFFVHDSAAANMTCEVDGPRTAFRPQGGVAGENREPTWVWWQDVFGAAPLLPVCAPLDPDPRANDVRGDARNIAPYLRLVRRGATFYGYASDDARDWRLLGAHSWIAVPGTLAVGPAVTSHADCGTMEVEVDRIAYGTGTAGAAGGSDAGGSDAAGSGAGGPADGSPAGDGPALGPARGPALLALPPLIEERFDGGDGGCPPGWICAAWGGDDGGAARFRPRVVGGRLRLADLRGSALGDGAGRATSAFFAMPVDARGSYVADFDVFFRYDRDAAGDGNPPADGMTFCMLGVSSTEAPREAQVGDPGEGLGYARINLPLDERRRSSRDLSRNSFAVELDTWHNGPIANDGDGANVSGWDPRGGAEGTGSGRWHVGLDVHASVASVQRNHDLGVRDEDLPDVFDPLGIHVRTAYDADRVRTWIRSNRRAGGDAGGREGSGSGPVAAGGGGGHAGGEGGSVGEGSAGGDGDDADGLLVLDARIEPLDLNAPAAVVGFTAATGAATVIIEVDGFTLRPLAPSRAPFHRGDATADGALDISDGILVLYHLFTGGPDPPCLEAANADDSPDVDITDAIYILNYLFLGGPAPPAPGPPGLPCGPDPLGSPSDLGCAAYPGC